MKLNRSLLVLALGLFATVGSAAPIDQVASGEDFICLLSQGKVKCNGNDYYIKQIPADLGPVTEIAAGQSHVCAISRATVRCWGRIHFYGNGDLDLKIEDVQNPRSLRVLNAGVCAATDNGRECWLGSLKNYPEMNKLLSSDVEAGSYLYSGNGPDWSGCGIKDGKVTCVKSRQLFGLEPEILTFDQLPKAKSFSFGNRFFLGQAPYVITEDGVYQLGDHFSEKVEVPVTNPTAIFQGTMFSCASGDEGLRCWANANWPENEFPKVPTDLNNISGFSAGRNHVCAISNGQAKCFFIRPQDEILLPEF